MKRSFTIFAAALFTFCSFSQVPQKMSYQAVVRDAGNHLVTGSAVGVQISILQGSPDGDLVYSETQTPVTNANGLVSIEIGGGEGFDAIDWTAGPYFVQTGIDPTGGNNYTILGTSQLLSVPYALHAQRAESLSGTVTETDPLYAASQALYITETDIANLSNLSGINTGDQDLSALVSQTVLADSIALVRSEIPDTGVFLTSETQGLTDVIALNSSANGQIKDVTDPTDPQDAATKNYTDQKINLLLNMLLSSGALNPSELESAGFSCDEMLDAGFTLQQLVDGDVTVEGLLDAGITVSQLISANEDVVDMFNAGIGVGTMEQNGESSADLTAGGLIGILSDIDGNNYKWVKIGNQIWMAENLKTTRYSNGTVIPQVTDDMEWGNLTTPAYCWYDDDQATYGNTYGAFYNWYAVDTLNLCPAGWHVSSDAEWTTLTNYLGGLSIAGGKLKETGTDHWLSPNLGATDEVGFRALPAGSGGRFNGSSSLGGSALWWTSTFNANFYSWYRTISFRFATVGRDSEFKEVGYSVRCVKD
jgi:uncharacterized protein (TIGR02145 family)